MNDAYSGVTADLAVASRMQYELDYTEGISLQMRIPERLKFGPDSAGSPAFPGEPRSTMMQVPDRIVVTGDESDPHYRSQELDLIQSIPMESVEMKTPPRVLTVQEQPLDLVDLEQESEAVRLKEEFHSRTRSRRQRETRHNGPIVKYDTSSPCPSAAVRTRPHLVSAESWQSDGSVGGVLSYIQLTTRRAYEHVLTMLDDPQRRNALVTLDAGSEGAPDDLALADAPALRRQIVKLNRRLQVLEHEHKERARRETVAYSITVAFWLLSAWMWVRR